MSIAFSSLSMSVISVAPSASRNKTLSPRALRQPYMRRKGDILQQKLVYSPF